MIVRALLSIGMLALLVWPAAARQATDANLITAIDVSGSIKAAAERLELTWANGEFIPLVPWTLIGSRTRPSR